MYQKDFPTKSIRSISMIDEGLGIVIVRLSNGLELVGDMIEANENQIALLSPLVIQYKTVAMLSFPIISFKRYALLSEDGAFVPFQRRDITSIVSARDSFARFYRASVSKDNQVKLLDDIFESIIHETVPVSEMSEEDKQKNQQHHYKGLLQDFDVRGVKPN